MYTAIIIEPRKHKALYFVLNNVLQCLSNEWNVVFFHGNLNLDYSIPIVDELNEIYNHRIRMVNLNVDNLDLISYSKLLATKSIVYDYIDTEYFLVFQTDSMILKKNIHLLDHFLNSGYDYIGAPWLISNYDITKKCDYIGNGGFSLRKTSKMLEIIETIQWNQIYEDIYFATNYPNIQVKKPTYNKALEFCFDDVFYPNSLACHKPWDSYHSKINFNEMCEIYPECFILHQLQGVK